MCEGKSNLIYSMCPDKGFSSPLSSGPLLASRRRAPYESRCGPQGRKRVDWLRAADGGAGLSGVTLSRAWPDADPCCSQTLHPCLNGELLSHKAISASSLTKVQRNLKPESPYLSGPTDLARARAARDVSVRLARGRRRRRGMPWREFRPLPVSSGGRRVPHLGPERLAGVERSGGAACTIPGRARKAAQGAGGPQNPLRPKSWRLACLGPEPWRTPGGVRTRCLLSLLALTWFPHVCRGHILELRGSPLTFHLLATCLRSLNDNCTGARCHFRA